MKGRSCNEWIIDNPIVAAVGSGDFTTTGYKDGQFKVNDPNSKKTLGLR